MNEGVPLELEVAQGRADRWHFDRLGYELKLGGAAGRPVVVYTSNHPDVKSQKLPSRMAVVPLSKTMARSSW